ncbi:MULTISPECIES: glycosyltransferase [Flavobacterium]|uniref:Glycosyltransferase n=1 Tax=Flavobacterium hankyongi TaxID=1176532 RepID=A0ABP9A1P5_9FLAO|nr:glycosyltransferase [Flavobacterium sp. N1846]
MKLLVVSAAPLIPSNNGWMAYGPYVKEMAIWAKHTDTIQFCCPVWETDRGLLVTQIPFETVSPVVLKDFNVTSIKAVLHTIIAAVLNLWLIVRAMRKADHIHLRCPGNIGLLGCVAQIFFPNTPKTAKYAGNWDPKAKQPLSYRIQKWILSNTFLTRNMKVLVYGEWEGSSKNIKPFFTASYTEGDKEDVSLRKIILQDRAVIRFLFVGTLSEGKRPLYAIKLVESLHASGYNVHLDLYGDGQQRKLLETYIAANNLTDFIVLKGNQLVKTVKKAYQESHFLLLPSKSEGWPKVVAEAMFWGCVPLSTEISCVPYMLGHGNRGGILTLNLEKDSKAVITLLSNEKSYQKTSMEASDWSRKYTIDYFESEIAKLVNSKR